LKERYLKVVMPFGKTQLSEAENAANIEANSFESPKQTIYDARALQATYESPAAFWKDHGFCLLSHKTKVTEWNEDYTNLTSEITTIYKDEIEGLIRNDIFPQD